KSSQLQGRSHEILFIQQSRLRDKTGETRVLKGLVARSVRRCAAFDPGGFDAAFSVVITPM
ncbi:hypothetical protein QIG56_02070, partial [Klebsiella pneumoniae]|nr:hypothetical protein [Klebsiella pneumoniae]